MILRAIAKTILILSLFILSSSLYSEIPRGRILSDAELLQNINLDLEGLKSVRSYFERGDTLNSIIKLAEYFRRRKKPRYFFLQDELVRRVKEFAHKYPNTVKEIENRVDSFVYKYGYDVDWFTGGKDKTGKIHTPAVVRYLARQWEAMDIGLLYHFAKLGLLTKGVEPQFYINFFMNHVRDFIYDYESGKVDTGGNDVFEKFYAGHRVRNWLFVYNLFLRSENFKNEDLIFMIKVFVLHAAKLLDQCRKFNYGNHQLVGAVGLYEVTLMFPEIKVFSEWNKQAMKIIMEHIEKEINDDGFQFERSSHYHLLDIINYFRVYQLSSLNGVQLPEVFLKNFRNMFDAVVKLSMPTKAMPILQDVSDTGRTVQTKICAEMSIGTILFKDATYKYFSCEEFPAEYYWFFDDNLIEEFYKIQAKEPSVGSIALEQTGYYVMRSGWNDESFYMVIDAGLSKYKPDHNHGGVLGIIAYANGKQILPNYSVNYTNPDYKFLKNSLAKNIAIVDTILHGREWVDNKARTGFGVWKILPNPIVFRYLTGEAFDYFSGGHDGYKFLGIDYQRDVIFIKPNYWVVVDKFRKTHSDSRESGKLHSYRQVWQGKYQVIDQGTLLNADKKFMLKCINANIQINQESRFGVDFVTLDAKSSADYQFITFICPFFSKMPRITNTGEKIIVEIDTDSGKITDEIYIGSSIYFKRKVNGKPTRFVCINGFEINAPELNMSIKSQWQGSFEVIYVEDKKQWGFRALDRDTEVQVKFGNNSRKFNVQMKNWYFF
jgi:hypothetical protein